MKKFFYYIFLLNLIPYIFCYIFNIRIDIKNDEEEIAKIRLYRTAQDKVEEMDLEEYIKGVIYKEMPASFNIEALKAQTVAARTYTYRKIGQNAHKNADICDNPAHCQGFCEKDDSTSYKKISEAVESTKGEVLTFEGNIINALYHSASGGKTENVSEVFAGGDVVNLSSVDSPGEEIMQNYETKVVISKKEFVNALKKVDKNFSYDGNIKILSRTEGGSVGRIKIGNTEFKGTKIRNIFNLRSSNFNIKNDDINIEINVKGYGHGVGLSQWGAEAMAREGKTYKEILAHYYRGTTIENY